jgi:hypothetical protein
MSSLHWWPESCDLAPQAETGAAIRRLTASPAITHNFYHEQPITTPDSRRLALFRTLDADPCTPGDLLVYDLETYKVCRPLRGVFGMGAGIYAVCTSSWSGVLFAVQQCGAEKLVVRLDLETLESTVLFPWPSELTPSLQSVSADGRWALTSARLDKNTFGIVRFDLQNGELGILHEGPHLVNPHLQYRLGIGDRILVQENRGCQMDDAGNLVRGCDERGVGLFSLNSQGGDRREFPIAPPLTPRTSGHECWIGASDRVIVTLMEPYHDGEKSGNVLEVSHDWPGARVVFDTPHFWNHISASRCGRYFVADGSSLPGTPLIVGCIATGRTEVLCQSLTSSGAAQFTHAHPYFTADNQWVIFNSDYTGVPQLYACRVPQELLQTLESGY